MENPGYIVRIPEPCSESWNGMQPKDQGRYCASCCKVVIDFSNKTDVEVRDILLSYSGQKVCGHFKKTQVDRPLSIKVDLTRLPHNMNSTKIFAIALFLVFGSFLFSCTNNHNKKVNGMEIETYIDSYSMGMIVAPPNISEYTELSGDIVIENEVDGEVVVEEMPPVIEAPYDSEEHIAGGLAFETVEAVRDTFLPTADTSSVWGGRDSAARNSTVDSLQNLSGTMAVTDEGEPGTNDEINPEFLVFPNPANGEFTVKYEVTRRSRVRIDLFDLQGAWLKTLVNIENQYEGRYEVGAGSSELTNGIYLVNMINNGRRSVKRLVVEK